MSETNTYTITKVMQLIPLNEGDQSFNVDFYLKAKEDFHFVIVDQEQLDAGSPLDYKQSDEGEVSGNITSNEGEFKSYYIGLKALSEKNLVPIELKCYVCISLLHTAFTIRMWPFVLYGMSCIFG